MLLRTPDVNAIIGSRKFFAVYNDSRDFFA
jgi:hypothetical protein